MASVVAVSALGWASDATKRALILDPFRVKEKGEIHRLLTAGWLHADLSHLAFNMFSLYMFAGPSAGVLGDLRFTILYVTAVVVAFVPTTIRRMNDRRYASLGASGAVAAVMFSAIALDPKMQLYLMYIPVPVPGVVFALGYLAYSAWRGHVGRDNVNHGAHFTGALYGALLTWIFEPARVERTIHAFF
jgi:membrane associated rhomboid family serine protease